MPVSFAPSWLVEAWSLCEPDPAAAHALATRHLEGTAQDTAWAWLTRALAESLSAQPLAEAASLPHARAAFDALSKEGADPHAASVLLTVAELARAASAHRTGDIEGLLKHARSAVETAARGGWAPAQSVALLRLAAWQHDGGDPEGALTAAEQAAALADPQTLPVLAAAAAAARVQALGTVGQGAQAAGVLAPLLDGDGPAAAALKRHHATAVAVAASYANDTGLALAWLDDTQPQTPAERLSWQWAMCRCLMAQRQPAEAARQAQAELSSLGHADRLAHAPQVLALLEVAADAADQADDPASALAHQRAARSLQAVLHQRQLRARCAVIEQAAQAKLLAQALRLQGLNEAEGQRNQAASDELWALRRQNAELQTQLQSLALRDDTTGLHNRRYLLEAAPALLHRAGREQQPLSLAVLHLDTSPVVDGSFGPGARDELLSRFGALLRGSTRGSDMACRVGENHFVLVFHGTAAAAARQVLQRMLGAWQALRISHEGQTLPASGFSAGVAAYAGPSCRVDTLMASAERTLRSALAAGPSQVAVCAESDA